MVWVMTSSIMDSDVTASEGWGVGGGGGGEGGGGRGEGKWGKCDPQAHHLTQLARHQKLK